jgi:hypothetical protein
MAAAGAGRSYPLSVVIQAVDKITGPLKKISGAVSAVGGRFSALGSRIRGMSDRAGLPVLANAFGQVGKSAGALVGKIAGIGKTIATMAAGAVVSLGLLSTAYADTTGAIGDMAERTGATRVRFQELSYAAIQTGATGEAVADAFRKMTLTVGQAAKGDKGLTEMFQGLQINLKNANGELKTSDELFDMFVNRISRIKNPALQATAATKIFGRGAADLLPLIRLGTMGIAELSEQAHRLGVVISDDAVRQGEEFGDTLDNLKAAGRGVFYTIAGQLVPALSKLAKQLIETIVKYRPQIEAFAAAFAKNLPGYIDRVSAGFTSLYDKLAPIGNAIVTVSENIGALNTVLVAIGTYMTVALAGAILNVALAIKGLGIAIAITPLGWFLITITAIAAAAFLIYKNWDGIAKFFTDKFTAVKDAFKTGMIDGMLSLWREFSPINLILDQFNALIKFMTGVDLGGMFKSKFSFGTPGAPAAAPGPNQNYTAVPEGGPIAAGLASAKAAITVDFKNMPQGTSVDTSATRGANIKTNQGYSMMSATQ